MRIVKRLLSLCALVIFSIDMNAQVSFGPENFLAPDAYGVTGSFVCDIDGDNDVDVLAASPDDHTLAWYKNLNGTGTFDAPIIISKAGSATSKVVAFDVDNDTDMDVVSNAGATGQLVLFKNNGGGIFANPIIIGGSNITQISANDINNDGKMDLVCYQNYNTITIYKNIDGNGSFAAIQNISNGGLDNFVLSDIDTDGHLDLVVSSKWYKNDSLGNFGSGNLIDINLLTYGLKGVSAGDLDGDGDNDLAIIVGFGTNGTTYWYENSNGKGTFIKNTLKLTRGDAEVIIHDFDNDNDQDIVTVGSDITLFKNTSPGNFVISTISTDFPQQVTAGDIDGDGDKDLVTTKWNYGELAWWENLGSGVFNTRKMINHPVSDLRKAATGDLDGDGDEDVISGSDNNLFWCKNTNGKGVFGSPIFLSESIANLLSISVVDLDADGDLDICVSTFTEIAWFKNTNGSGTFSSKIVISSDALGNYSPPIVFADFDKDNDEDIVVYNNALGKLYWLKNVTGKGVFGGKQIISDTLSSVIKLFVKDMDLDGDLDVVGANSVYGKSKIVWFENTNSLGAFSSEKLISKFTAVGQRLFQIELADIDGDLDDDFIISQMLNYSTITIDWLENVNGNYSNAHFIDIGQNFNSSDGNCIFSSDINGDGYKDLLISFGYGLYFYSNLDGLGTFSSSQKLAKEGGGTFIGVDFDGDSDQDLLGTTDEYLFWKENLTTIVTEVDAIEMAVLSKPVVYPTLVNDEITMKISDEILQNFMNHEVAIFNLLGDKIQHKYIDNNVIQFQLNDLPGGIYILKTTNFTSKFIKQ